MQKIKKYLLLLHRKFNIYRLYEQKIDVFGSTRDDAAFGKRSEKGVYHRGFVQGEGRHLRAVFAVNLVSVVNFGVVRRGNHNARNRVQIARRKGGISFGG